MKRRGLDPVLDADFLSACISDEDDASLVDVALAPQPVHLRQERDKRVQRHTVLGCDGIGAGASAQCGSACLRHP
jgi:hypothetical protein